MHVLSRCAEPCACEMQPPPPSRLHRPPSHPLDHGCSLSHLGEYSICEGRKMRSMTTGEGTATCVAAAHPLGYPRRTAWARAPCFRGGGTSQASIFAASTKSKSVIPSTAWVQICSGSAVFVKPRGAGRVAAAIGYGRRVDTVVGRGVPPPVRPGTSRYGGPGDAPRPPPPHLPC
jgi:hypothetical protein